MVYKVKKKDKSKCYAKHGNKTCTLDEMKRTFPWKTQLTNDQETRDDTRQ